VIFCCAVIVCSAGIVCPVFAGAETYDKSVQEYTAAIDRDPKNRQAYYGRGGEYDKAVRDFTAAIALNAQDAKAYSLPMKSRNRTVRP
jgi:hypothetical protein